MASAESPSVVSMTDFFRFLEVSAETERSFAVHFYSNWIPCACASRTISSGQREHWTSPICALRR